MSAPALSLLLGRLLWPVASVRWEAARALAALIEGGDSAAAMALLEWIAACRLESDAATGLSVIDAFALEARFDGLAVAAAVRAPSVLSEVILRRCFGVGNLSAPDYAPSRKADVSVHIADYFERRMDSIIPRSFHDHFERLEEDSGLPFLARWAHEWCWLQATHDEPLSSDPYWFQWREHGGVGYFDQRQREVYLSAYLRTLAFAATHWQLGRANTEGLAQEAVAGLRGLSRLEFQARPTWSQGLTVSIEPPEALAARLWSEARAALPAGRELLALRCADLQPRGFVEIEVGLSASPGPWPAEPVVEGGDALIRPMILAEFDGGKPLVFPAGRNVSAPTPLTVTAVSPTFARWHLDLFKTEICLAWPGLFITPPSLSIRPDAVVLEVGEREASRFWAWNVDWEPTAPSETGGRGGRITDIDGQDLAAFTARTGQTLRRAALVRIGYARSDYKDYKVETHRIWLDPP